VLKGDPSLKYSAQGFFTQIRPVWVGDPGKKIQNFDGFLLFSAVADIAKNISPIKSER
jgi:hypothetical protein